MAKKPTVVRFVLDDRVGMRLLIEQLRYAGILSVYDGKVNLYAPKGVMASAWAKMNAKRMQSFGIDAAAVPES